MLAKNGASEPTHSSASTTHGHNSGLMLGQRRRWWTNLNLALARRLVSNISWDVIIGLPSQMLVNTGPAEPTHFSASMFCTILCDFSANMFLYNSLRYNKLVDSLPWTNVEVLSANRCRRWAGITSTLEVLLQQIVGWYNMGDQKCH